SKPMRDRSFLLAKTYLPRRADVLRRLLCLFFLAITGSTAQVSAQEMNGFDLKDSLIPVTQINFGGPDKDGIPSIDKPDFLSAGFAAFLRNNDQVLGLTSGTVARAYPLRILNWHEVVNDRIGTNPVVITFCPLCGTGVAFDARVDGRALSFGVSGLLYNSDVLLYDRQTNSLWSQLLGQAISGPLKGRRLTMLPLTHTTWADWRKAHPATQVLSTHTGTVRPYMRDPYDGYEKTEDLMFPVQFRAVGFHPKERVLGIRIDGRTKAYPFVELGKTSGEFVDRIGDTVLTIRFDRNALRATAHGSDGQQLAAVVGYWFAWYAFNPGTEVFRAGESAKPRQ
ncbi:MAG: DUF3179 domain-containing protein, partial [Rhodocyclaceae bacterium]|nr:DUF3179 domain-containing protein [Rhodocyclaceae bacterium]